MMGKGLSFDVEAKWKLHESEGHTATRMKRHRFGVWVEVHVCERCKAAFVTNVGKMPGPVAAVRRFLHRGRRS